jgi:hypothetical protein
MAAAARTRHVPTTIDDPAAVLAQFLDSYEKSGPSRNAAALRLVAEACGSIPLHRGARAAGDWFLERVTASFRRRSITRFFETVETAPESALATVAADFTATSDVLAHVGEHLRMPTLVAAFEAAVRVDLVESRPQDAPDFDPDEDIAGALDAFLSSPTAPLDDGVRRVDRQPFLRFLEAHARGLLHGLESTRSTLMAARDEVLPHLHTLGVAQLPPVRMLWASVAASLVSDRVALVGGNLQEAATEELLEWKERVIDAFADVVIGGVHHESAHPFAVDRTFRSEWSAHFTEALLHALGELRIASFYDLVVDFPDSRPALVGLAQCMRRVPPLHRRLTEQARSVLGQRLHHAGTRTEDVLSVLVSAIRALAALYPRGEAGAAIAEICGPTLNHLRKRRDAVGALVADMTRKPGSADAHVLQLHTASDADAADDAQLGVGAGHTDVLRVLLSALSLPAVIREYRAVLAQALLDPAAQGTVDNATEVLERMKGIFGEDALAQCVVMVRDVDTSRRVNQWMVDRWRQRPQEQPSAPSRLTVLSGTCWPPATVRKAPTGEAFTPHPQLAGCMEAMLKTFRVMKPSQQLVYHLNNGAVTLTLALKDRVTGRTVERDEMLSPLVASAVLFLNDAASPVPLADLAAKLGCSPAFVDPLLQLVVPRVLTRSGSDASPLYAVQVYEVAAGGNFAEAEQASTSEAPSFVSPEELKIIENMSANMLKTGGTKTGAQIENSLRMFGKFRGTSAQAKEVLMYLVSQGKITTPDGGVTFAIPK